MMSSLTEFEGKKKKKNPTHKSKSLTQWFEREKKRLNLLNCVFSGSRRERERERERLHEVFSVASVSMRKF